MIILGQDLYLDQYLKVSGTFMNLKLSILGIY